jgi:hypothetical protein
MAIAYPVMMPLHTLTIMTCAVALGSDGWPSFTATTARWPIDEGGNGRTYAVLMVDGAWSWHAARELALAAGGDLASGGSQAELSYVIGLAQSASAFACVGPWIGGHRPAGGAWVWTDGTPFDGFAWSPGRPAQSNVLESALCLVGDGAPMGTWIDALPGPDAGALVSSAVVRWDSFVDCDHDGVPDALEILSDPALDADWDGVLDQCPPIVPEDIDQDGRVNGVDLGLVLSSWGPVDGTANRADINGDGLVDGADFSRLLAGWTG